MALARKWEVNLRDFLRDPGDFRDVYATDGWA